jgi:hypothetical protein
VRKFRIVAEAREVIALYYAATSRRRLGRAGSYREDHARRDFRCTGIDRLARDAAQRVVTRRPVSIVGAGVFQGGLAVRR